ncbi:MAG: hypothetical protein ABIR16_06635, partial [Dokdonella sp.]
RERYLSRESRIASTLMDRDDAGSVDAPLPTIAVATTTTALSRKDVLDAIARGRSGRRDQP